MSLVRALAIVVLTSTLSLAAAGCATTGSNQSGGGDDELNDTCGAIILAAISIPCAIAWGTGCVVGGCTACYEHQSEGAAPDNSAAAPEVAPADGDEEAQSVAY